MSKGFGKFYAKTFTGSMIGAGADVFAVWSYCIANAGPPAGTVELNPRLIGMLLGMEERAVITAIKYLCAPDPKSRSQAEDGKRLLKLSQYEFQLVTWAEHRVGVDDEARREYFRRKKQEERKRKAMSNDVKRHVFDSLRQSSVSTQAEAEAEAEEETDMSSAAPTPPLCRIEPDLLKIQWNEMAEKTGLPGVRLMSKKRISTLKQRSHEKEWRESWQEALSKIPGSPFLRGDSGRGWRGNIDWFLKPDSVNKIMEGAYDGTPKAQGVPDARRPESQPNKFDGIGTYFEG